MLLQKELNKLTNPERPKTGDKAPNNTGKGIQKGMQTRSPVIIKIVTDPGRLKS
jgi:hypothetical protein